MKSGHFSFVTSAEDAGLRLDHFLKRRLPEFSRSQIQKWIRKGSVLCNGRAASSAQSLRASDRITLSIPEEESTILPQAIPIHILYEDDQLLAVDKPAGMLTHPTAKDFTGTLANAVAHRLRRRESDAAWEGMRPGIVHRLDRETSGILIVAKNVRALEKISREFRQRNVKKTYRAVVSGVVPMNRGEIDGPIGPERGRGRMAVIPSGRASQTAFRVLKRFPRHTYLEVYPKTGRTHQIRVHLAKIGYPVLGDSLYGSKEEKSSRLMLHAYSISFPHPATKKELRFRAPLPRDFTNELKTLSQPAL